MNGKFKLVGKPTAFWLFALAAVIMLGIYLLNQSPSAQAVQAFAGGYNAPNRSFTDLMGS